MQKLIRITTIPLSLEKLLEGQLTYMNSFYEVTAVAAEKDRLEQYGFDNGVNTFFVEMTRAITPLKDLKAVWKLYRFLKIEKPLIVHTHTPKAGIVGMLAAKMAGVPLRLHTVAGLPLLETRGLKRKILDRVEKFTYALATQIYPNSVGLKEIIIKEGFARENKLKILGRGSSNGIDTAYFNPDNFPFSLRNQIRTQLEIPKEDFVFIFIGRLVSEKGINELVAAFKDLQKKREDLSLLLVGPFEQELDPLSPQTLDEIETNKKISTTGYQQDVRPYLALANALVFPSYREGFPNVVMQAGAMGLPSIVTNINGCNEIIAEGVNGKIIPVKDKKSLYEAMDSFIHEPVMLKELSQRSRQIICAKYDRKEFWNLLKQEYELLERDYKRSGRL